MRGYNFSENALAAKSWVAGGARRVEYFHVHFSSVRRRAFLFICLSDFSRSLYCLYPYSE